jgi:alkyl sulfatase BDS1-like metallo-beta-lactamase superfamily hydrolase
VDLEPTPRAELAKKYVEMMGGHDRVLGEARKSFDAGKAELAAELSTLLVRMDTKDEAARHLKAAAFRKLGYAQMNASWRNYYLVSAMELDGQIPEEIYLHQARGMLGPALGGLPPENQIASLPSRLVAEKVFDEDVVVGVRYADAPDTFRLHLRRGVLEVSKKPIGDAAFTLGVTRAGMGKLLAGTAAEDLLGSAITVDGDATRAAKFLASFERAFEKKPEVVVR